MKKQMLSILEGNKTNLSSRKSFVRDLPSAKSLLNKEQQPYYMKQAEGPGQRPAGTTTFFYNGGFTPALVIPVLAVRADAGYSAGYKSGFTLIELLVVVLIIGILASVALPQYQKAVEKARASEALPLLKSVYQAAKAYQMANGEWPEKFDELAVEIPWTGNVKWRSDSSVMRDTRSNSFWSLQIYKETGFRSNITLGRISGKYEGVGFLISEEGVWNCVEKTSDGKVFSGNAGDYCVKIMRCSNTPSTYPNGRYYPYQP